MPSACRMPSIFGPTPEISFRSSTAAGLSIAGAVGSAMASTRRLCAAASCRDLRCLAAPSTAGCRLVGVGGLEPALARLPPSRPPGWPSPATATSAPDSFRPRRSSAWRHWTAELRRLPPGRCRASRASARVSLVARRLEHGRSRSSARSGPPAARRQTRSICGPGWHRRPLAGRERVDDLFEPLGRQVLVGVLEDHHHRRVDAGAEALDLFPRQRAVGIGVELVVMDLRLGRRPSALRRRAACTASCRRPGHAPACRPASAGTGCRRSRLRARGYRACRACRRRARSPAR